MEEKDDQQGVLGVDTLEEGMAEFRVGTSTWNSKKELIHPRRSSRTSRKWRTGRSSARPSACDLART